MKRFSTTELLIRIRKQSAASNFVGSIDSKRTEVAVAAVAAVAAVVAAEVAVATVAD